MLQSSSVGLISVVVFPSLCIASSISPESIILHCKVFLVQLRMPLERTSSGQFLYGVKILRACSVGDDTFVGSGKSPVWHRRSRVSFAKEDNVARFFGAFRVSPFPDAYMGL
jgi:hypothetical protein